MFDSVGRSLDDGAAARQAASAGIVGLLGLLTAGSIVLAGVWTVKAAIVEAVGGEDLVVFELAAEMLTPEMPPPPPPAASAAVVASDDDAPDESEEMIEQVKALDPEIDAAIEEARGPADEGAGEAEGVAGGVPGGVPGGDPNGEPEGRLGARDRPTVFHHTRLEVKRRVEPRYPSAARGLGLGDQRCRTTVRIGDDGVPYEIDVAGCPNLFHDEVRASILRWRWYPGRDGAAKVAAQTTIMIVFRETG